MTRSTDLKPVKAILDRTEGDAGRLLEILHGLQEVYGYIRQDALEAACKGAGIRVADAVSVASFYDRFRMKPAGRHTIRVCVGTACHVKGAELVYDAFRRNLDIAEGGDTDSQGMFTVEKVACLGCCTLAPAVQIGRVTYGHVSPDAVAQVLEDYACAGESHGLAMEKLAGQKAEGRLGQVRIGLGSCCVARGSGRLLAGLYRQLELAGCDVRIRQVGCVGACYQTPMLEVVPPQGEPHLYTAVTPANAGRILSAHFKSGSPVARARLAADRLLDGLLGAGPAGRTRRKDNACGGDLAEFLSPQVRIATEHCGLLDPLDMDQYIATGGFEALKKSLHDMTAEQVISQIRESGLRGRGGAGYPAFLKWQQVRDQRGPKKHVVCNGDEGDPGAFMDRMLMESYPFRIIEAMAIAAAAVGADEGRIYVRAEYNLAVDRLLQAIEACRRRGLLGEKILAGELSFDVKIVRGAGAFVCGEETALLASIEGRRGMPVPRPPYPSQKGLWQKPTLVGNVETFAVVPWIIRNTGAAFRAIGTGSSSGTKVFALAGKVARGGLIEVPMGITIRTIVEKIGGGIAGEKRFKAVQIGGPSGGCIPAGECGVAVDYESLEAAGAIMGSGGLVVLDESDCLVDIARYFLQFTQNQSCGRCTLCRIGTRRMLEMLEDLTCGRAGPSHLERLEDLAVKVKAASLCGLGRTAPNPVLSTLKYFRDEYDAHIDGRCPAGRCKALVKYSINDDCIGCTLCSQNCPADAIGFRPYERHEIDNDLCIRCGTCRGVCPSGAVEVN